MNTHTIDERWEASLLHRVEVGPSECAEDWSARGANGERRGRYMGCLEEHGVVTPSMDIARLTGAAAPPSGEPRAAPATEKGTTIAPPPGPTGPPPGANKGEFGIARRGIIGIGIGIGIASPTCRTSGAIARDSSPAAPPSGLPSAQLGADLPDTANPPHPGEGGRNHPPPRRQVAIAAVERKPKVDDGLL